ncbi:MAG TPA: hypothetical protein VGG02_04260 [Chthoniobacterales bacterium]|jgi:hypothetical protein
MSKIIDTIENEPITLGDDGKVTYKSKAAIDADGSGPSHGDPDWQNDTTLHHNGQALNADVDQYIVVPPAIIHGVEPIVLGSQAHVTNTLNGSTCDAVVGDIGPHRKLGEISVATARALGIPSSPLNGGVDDHVIEYVIEPGVPAQVDGVTYQLQPSHAR